MRLPMMELGKQSSTFQNCEERCGQNFTYPEVAVYNAHLRSTQYIILRLKCPEFNLGSGSAPEPSDGAPPPK